MFAIKRLIGRRFDEEEAQKDVALVPFKIVKVDNGDAWVDVAGKRMAPQEVSARVLAKMKQVAEEYLGQPVSEAVITVPAYFKAEQRGFEIGEDELDWLEAEQELIDQMEQEPVD